MQRNYWLLHLGEKNRYSEIALQDNFIGVGWQEYRDSLTNVVGLNWQQFKAETIPGITKVYPDKPKNALIAVSAQLNRFINVMQVGDIVLMPHQDTALLSAGEIIGEYEAASPDNDCPYVHRRKVKWLKELPRASFSEPLRNSAGAIMTIFSLNPHAEELERLLGSQTQQVSGESLESLSEFGLEAHLEEFLIHNWKRTELGKGYDIYTEDGVITGQQYPTATGPIDILAQSTDGKELLILELKKGRSGDAVVGQILRYIGFVQANLAEKGQTVRGLIITGKDDQKIRYAISTLPHVDFMTYQVSFKLKALSL